jgi:hypothetical protein
VNVSAHNNESGQYQTHIYLYDNVGNVSSFATSGAFLEPEVPAGWIPIRTPEELNNIRYNLSGYYYVVNNIDLSTSAYSANWTPIDNFVGKLDGANHKIIGLKINRGGWNNTGLFGVIGTSEIKNIEFVNASVSAAGSYVGTLVGNVSNAVLTLTNVKVNSTVNGSSYVGGIVGQVEHGLVTMNNCSSSGFVGGYYGGGLIGYVLLGSIDVNNSYSSSTISSTGAAGGLIGAFIGFQNTSTETLTFQSKVTKSYATGSVNGTFMIGGLIGYTQNMSNMLVISRSYATGDVNVTGGSGTLYAGGLIGKTEATVYDVYALGTVNVGGYGNSSILGGLIGSTTAYIDRVYAIGKINYEGSTPYRVDPLLGIGGSSDDHLYWDTTLSGIASAGVGRIGKTTAEMYQQSTYVGFDFTNVWYASGTTYPTFR